MLTATVLCFFLLQLTADQSVTGVQQEGRTLFNKGRVHLRSPDQKRELETQGWTVSPLRCYRTHLGQNKQILSKGAVSLGYF